jgi:hypothetical protein
VGRVRACDSNTLPCCCLRLVSQEGKIAHDFAKTDELRALLAAALSEASPSQEDPLAQPNTVAVTEGASTTPCAGENGLNDGTAPEITQHRIRTALATNVSAGAFTGTQKNICCRCVASRYSPNDNTTCPGYVAVNSLYVRCRS